MPDEIEVVAEAPAAAPDNAAALPETAEPAEKTGEPGAPESVEEETDEQKNERVQREAAEASAKRAEKQSRGVQKRIDELTADKHAERKRADELAALLKQTIESRGNGQGAPAKTDGAPTRDQFDSYEEYLRADARYVAQQEAKSLIETATKANQEAAAKFNAEKAANESKRTYATREAEIAKTIPDYREVMEDSDVSVPQGVLNTIQKMPDGPLIAYHLAKQPELAKQFWENPGDAAMHGIILGQISATLKATPSKVSNAPPPGKGVGSKPAPSNGPPSDPKAYMAWAEKHMPKGRS